MTRKMLSRGESVEFPGKGIVHLAADPNLMKKSGCIHMTTDLARHYGFKVCLFF